MVTNFEEEIKKILRKREKEKFGSRSFRFSTNDYKIKGYYYGSFCDDRHEIIYTVRDRKTTGIYEIIHYLPRIAKRIFSWDFHKKDMSWSAKKARFSAWYHLCSIEKTGKRRIGELVCWALLGCYMGHTGMRAYAEESLFYAVLCAIGVIYFVRFNLYLSWKSNREFDRKFKEEYGIEHRVWMKQFIKDPEEAMKRLNRALEKYELGEFKKKNAKEFLKEINRW